MRFRLLLLTLAAMVMTSRVFSQPPPDPDPDPDAPVVQAISWEGNLSVSSATLNDRILVKQGQPFVATNLRMSVHMVRSLYQDKGFYRVEVSTQVTSPGKNVVDVAFRVHEGNAHHIGAIDISGNKKISKKIILRSLRIHTGDLFSQSKIFESNRDLYSTGYFDAINITYSTPTAHVVDVHVAVVERATRYMKGNAGYGTQTKESVMVGYEDTNFFGGARKLDISVTHSGFVTNPSHYRTTLIQSNLVQPFIFDSPYEATINVAREYDDREAYDSYSTATRFGIGRRFSTEITASIRYRYQGTQVRHVSPEALTTGFTNVSAVGPTFAFDDTNDPFLPTIGWRVLGTYEEGMKFFAGDVRFHKLESRVGRFDRIFGQWVLFEGLQGGAIIPDSTSDQNIIPIYERYFIGGANTVRGYSERTLGPKSSIGTPLGGNMFLVGNLEVRHPIYKKLWGVAFVDGGQLYAPDLGHRWPDIPMNDVNDFQYGTGLGLRLNSPIGAIRLEFGYKINPPENESFWDRTAIHFSIGEVF